MLLFSLSAIVSVELSLACNIQIEENERGTFQILAPFNFPANALSNPEVILA